MNTPVKALIAAAITALTVTACGGSSAVEDGWTGCKAREVAAKISDPTNFTGPAEDISWPLLSEVAVEEYDTGIIAYDAVVMGRSYTCLADPERDIYQSSWG